MPLAVGREKGVNRPEEMEWVRDSSFPLQHSWHPGTATSADPALWHGLGIFALTRPAIQSGFERGRTLAILAIAIPPVLVVALTLLISLL